MVVSVLQADYIKDYKIKLQFDNGEKAVVDLKDAIFKDHRKIFEPLRDVEFFKKFELDSWTLLWPNGADFAPEFLYELATEEKTDHKKV